MFFFTAPKYDLTGKYSALDVAAYLINKAANKGKCMSNLQLQKILYYIQTYFLQEKHYALFKDEIEAWHFGPVVRDVYRRYCGYGSMRIPAIDTPICNFTKEEQDIMDSIADDKMAMAPWDLVEATHEPHRAWDLVYQDGEGNKSVIPKDVIINYGG